MCVVGFDAELWAVAADLAAAGRFDRLHFVGRQPVLPALAGALVPLAGDPLRAVGWVSGAAAGGFVAATGWLAARWFGRAAGVVAALVVGTHSAWGFYSGAGMAESLSFLAHLAVAAAMIALVAAPSARAGAVVGGALALALAVKPNAVLLVPLMAGLAARGGARTIAAAAAALIVPHVLWFVVAEGERSAVLEPFRVAFDPVASAKPGFEGHGVGGSLRRLADLLPLAPLIAPLPLALVYTPDPVARRRLAVLCAAGASALFALPAMWQIRHLLPYVALLVVAAAAAVPALVARGRPGVAGLAAALMLWPALIGPSDTHAAWAAAGAAVRCTPAVRATATWLREHVDGGDPDQVLATHDAALRGLSGFVSATPTGRIETADRERQPTVWVALGPGLPMHRNVATRLRALVDGPGAELVVTLDGARVWRVDADVAPVATP